MALVRAAKAWRRSHSSTVGCRDAHRTAVMQSAHHKRPPAIIVGGIANALSIVRSLGRAGIESYAINHPQAAVKYSRFCKWIDIPKTPGTVVEAWAAYLLGRE